MTYDINITWKSSMWIILLVEGATGKINESVTW